MPLRKVNNTKLHTKNINKSEFKEARQSLELLSISNN